MTLILLKRYLTVILFSFLLINSATAQQIENNDTIVKVEEKKPILKWFERIQIRGYVQARYNGLLVSNPELKCEQCDRSWGGNSSFFLRRIRIIFFGQLSPRVYFYVQPDFASSTSATNLHFAQIRDAYFDVSIDKKGEFRFRIGQSKVPFGFENMQSSQNRLPLDRNDALNSALSNERDLGVFFYWAPRAVRDRFSMLVSEGYKGSGDYGVFGIGLYNGQTANKPELNNNKHVVARVSYPFKIKNQIIEPGFQSYTGEYVVAHSQLSSGVKYKENLTYLDQRVAASFIMYPRPFGIQAEYNIGKGPEFNAHTDSIEQQNLTGGYITLNYMLPIKKQLLFPFVRMQYYEGGKKHEKDARSHKVNEIELGIEWQPLKNFEFVAMYTISSRRFEDFELPNNLQQGRLLRLQAQVNF